MWVAPGALLLSGASSVCRIKVRERRLPERLLIGNLCDGLLLRLDVFGRLYLERDYCSVFAAVGARRPLGPEILRRPVAGFLLKVVFPQLLCRCSVLLSGVFAMQWPHNPVQESRESALVCWFRMHICEVVYRLDVDMPQQTLISCLAEEAQFGIDMPEL